MLAATIGAASSSLLGGAGSWAAQIVLHVVWCSGVMLGLSMRPGLWERMDGTPIRTLGAANHLTLLRLYFLPTVVALVLGERWLPAFALYLVLALTDVADGFLARRSENTTKLGYVMDLLGDMALNAGLTLALAATRAVPEWVGLLALGRYGGLVVGAAWFLFRRGELRIGPTRLGKLTGFGIAATTFLVLVSKAFPRLATLREFSASLLGVLLGIGLLQAAILGWNRWRKPAEGNEAWYRRGGTLENASPGPARSPGSRDRAEP